MTDAARTPFDSIATEQVQPVPRQHSGGKSRTDWSATRIASLKQLYADGLSIVAIARELGIGKNAVAAAVQRFGLLRQKTQPMRSSWNAEREATLRSMWSQGFSASQIAEDLGGISRNGVIAKTHRLDLPAERPLRPRLANSMSGKPAADHRWRNKPKTAPKKKPHPRGHSGQFRKIVTAGTAEPRISKPPTLPPERIETTPTETRKPLLDLRAGECIWPCGDPRDPGFAFCGQPTATGRRYCAEHHARSIVATVWTPIKLPKEK